MKVLHANGEVTSMRKLEDGEQYLLKDLQEAVDGYVEIAWTGELDGELVHLLVNEEGQLWGLPFNEDGSRIAGRMLVGPVAVIRQRDIN